MVGGTRGDNPQCGFFILSVLGPAAHSLFPYPKNIPTYQSLKIDLIYTLGILLEKLTQYLHGGRLTCCRKVPSLKPDNYCFSMWKTLYSLTFGNNQSIVLRKKINTLLHSKPLNQSSRISKSQRTRPHPGFSTRLWCVNIKKVLSLGLYRHSSFCLLCHQMFCEWIKMVAATATPLELQFVPLIH